MSGIKHFTYLVILPKGLDVEGGEGVAPKTKINLKCSPSHPVSNEISLKCQKPSVGPVVLVLGYFFDLDNVNGKKGPNTLHHGQGHFYRN